MYEEHVLGHYQVPYHRGRLYKPTHRGTAVSTVCGDHVTIELHIANDQIGSIAWDGYGCCFSQAAASMLVKHLHGRESSTIDQLNEADMFRLFQADVPDVRRQCVLVAYHALKNLETV